MSILEKISLLLSTVRHALHTVMAQVRRVSVDTIHATIASSSSSPSKSNQPVPSRDRPAATVGATSVAMPLFSGRVARTIS
eukprot:411633-Prymnesium_polylepis.1